MDSGDAHGRFGRRSRGGSGYRYVAALLVALCAHAVAVLLWELTGGDSNGGPTTLALANATAQGDDPPIEVQSLVDELKRPDALTKEEKRREEEAKKEQEQQKAPGQVVDLPRPAIEQRPDKSDYVSEYDSKVDHQTKAPASRDRSGAPAQPLPPTPAVAAAPPHPVGLPHAAEAPAHGDHAGQSGAEPRVASAGGSPESSEAPPAADGTLPMAGRPTKAATGSGGTRTGRLAAAGGSSAVGDSGPQGEPPTPTTMPNLTPTREMLERAVGRGAGSMDYLHDVDDGDATALNSKKWLHAVFFNRVKRAVAQEWHADLVYMAHDPTGHIYGVKDRVTVLRVHLMPDGSLVGSDLVQSSGVDFLDDEAIAAFKKAAPFQNPPAALVEGDGRIHFNFAFVMELSGRSSMKVYKYE